MIIQLQQNKKNKDVLKLLKMKTPKKNFFLFVLNLKTALYDNMVYAFFVVVVAIS